MKININYLNDQFAIEFDEEMAAGSLVAHLIHYLQIPVPLLNFYNNKIALQLWSSNYSLDLKKSVKEQIKFINIDTCLSLNQTVHNDIDEFNEMISQFIETGKLEEVMIIRVENKYSKFRDILRKGPDTYIEIIKNRSLEKFISDPFIENDFQKLKTDFDFDGLFTRNLIKANYFVDDKSCDEESLEAIAAIARQTFDDDSCEYFVTMVFPDDKAFTIDKYRKADMAIEETNALYVKYGHPSYKVKLKSKGEEAEAEFESLRYSLNERLNLFNTLLAKIERKDKWFMLSNGYCLLATPEQHDAFVNSHLLPPDLSYFNPWEY